MADVVVEVPDALQGYLLSRRLRMGDVICGDDGGWILSISSRRLKFPDLVRHVQYWMRQESIAATTVRWNGEAHLLKVDDERQRPPPRSGRKSAR
jgi:hypothetical protein